MRIFLLLLAVCSLLFSQRPEFGIIGGIPATSTFDSGFVHEGNFDPKTIRYTLGPTVDFPLPGPLRKAGIGIEIDALYQRFGYHANYYEVPADYSVSGTLWQFPALVSMRIPLRKFKPFVEAGPSVQVIHGASNFYGIVNFPTGVGFGSSMSSLTPTSRAVAGFAAGAGLEFHLGLLKIAPSVRYTRWGDRNIDLGGNNGTRLNQVQILVAFRL